MQHTFTAELRLDGAAFHYEPDEETGPTFDPGPELARILRGLADRIEAHDWHPGHSITVLDVNGNDIGRARIGQPR